MSWRLEKEEFYPGRYYSPEYRIGKAIALESWDFNDGYYRQDEHARMKPRAFRVIVQKLGSPKFMREDDTSAPHVLWEGENEEEAQKAFEFWVK